MIILRRVLRVNDHGLHKKKGTKEPSPRFYPRFYCKTIRSNAGAFIAPS
jgi:hypothetical protein